MQKKQTICLIIAILCVLSSYCTAAEKLVFGVTPWKSPDELHQMHQPLMNHLENDLGVKLIFIVAENYQDLADRIDKKLIDIGSFSANAYVAAKQRFPDLKYIVSVQKKDVSGILKSYYRGIILTLKTSGIQDLKDLKGKKMGFTDPQSSSGYIYPKLLLKHNNIDPKTFFTQIFFVKKHDKIIRALLKGSIDAGATYEDMAVLAARTHGAKFKILATTPEIPFDAFAAGAHVPDTLCINIQKSLSETVKSDVMIHPKTQGAPEGFVVRDDAYYNIIREANRQLKNQ